MRKENEKDFYYSTHSKYSSRENYFDVREAWPFA
jgi:hypothetical protein